MEPTPRAVEVQSLNHRIAREAPLFILFYLFIYLFWTLIVLVNITKIVFIVDILVPLSPASGKDSHIPTSSPTHDIVKVLHLGAIWGKENTAS